MGESLNFLPSQQGYDEREHPQPLPAKSVNWMKKSLYSLAVSGLVEAIAHVQQGHGRVEVAYFFKGVKKNNYLRGGSCLCLTFWERVINLFFKLSATKRQAYFSKYWTFFSTSQHLQWNNTLKNRLLSLCHQRGFWMISHTVLLMLPVWQLSMFSMLSLLHVSIRFSVMPLYISSRWIWTLCQINPATPGTQQQQQFIFYQIGVQYICVAGYSKKMKVAVYRC